MLILIYAGYIRYMSLISYYEMLTYCKVVLRSVACIIFIRSRFYFIFFFVAFSKKELLYNYGQEGDEKGREAFRLFATLEHRKV